ncbi:hypothetical protein MW887_005862 [Aspergillus wentii]|nr:hypothetical protein MW887_005862 [Aspergillus wentii]
MPSMNQKKFVEQFKYALESNFTSPSGEPALLAPDHPKKWGQERARIQLDGEAKEMTLSPDKRFVAVSIEKEIHVFDVAGEARAEVLKGHVGIVDDIKFAPGLFDSNGARYMLASGSGGYGDEQMVILWELDENGKLISRESEKTLDVDALTAKALQPLISELADSHGWNPAGKAITTLEEDVRNALRNAIAIHEQEDKHCLAGELASFGSPAFGPDGKTLIYLTQNHSTQEETREAASLPCVNIWDVQSKSLRHQLRGHTDSIMWAATSPDNKLIASIAWDGTARIWDASSGECLHILGPFNGQLWSGAFSPDSTHLAISQGSPNTHLHVYNIHTGTSVSCFDEFERWARSISWSQDGSMLAGAGEGGTLYVWDPYTGVEKMRRSLALDDPMMSRFAGISGVQFVDGGRKLVFQIRDGTVEVYDFEKNVKQLFLRGRNVPGRGWFVQRIRGCWLLRVEIF